MHCANQNGVKGIIQVEENFFSGLLPFFSFYLNALATSLL